MIVRFKFMYSCSWSKVCKGKISIIIWMIVILNEKRMMEKMVLFFLNLFLGFVFLLFFVVVFRLYVGVF